MAVYVDDMGLRADVQNGARIVSSRWCHLMADTYAELEEFARRLRLAPSWVQIKPSGVHYDLTEGKRRQALALGAVHLPIHQPGGVGLNSEWERVCAAARDQYETGLEGAREAPHKSPSGGRWDS